MKKYLLALVAFFLCANFAKAQEQPFFDTSDAPKFFTFGARLGFNTSNRTFPKGYNNLWNHDSWGTGFNVGAVASLNFKEYLSVQPGIFFESRSGDFAYLTEYLNHFNLEETHYEMGHLRAYYFTIPVVGVAKFNLAQNIKWMVEFGPYFQICIKENGQNNVNILYRLPQGSQYSFYVADHRGFDIGFKMGTGLRFYKHYYVGVHYLAGACNAWKNPAGGRNKSWMFSLGYDF